MSKLTSTLEYAYSSSSFFDIPREKLFPTSITQIQGLFITELLSKCRPQNIIELGGGFGISCLWIENCCHWPHHHTVVESDRKSCQLLSTVKKELNLKSIKIVHDSTQHYLATKLASEPTLADVFFIDACELFDGLMVDLHFCNKLLAINGLIILRNSWNPSIRKAVSFVLENLPYELVPQTNDLLTKHSLKSIFIRDAALKRVGSLSCDFLILKKTSADLRPWNHFSAF